MKTLLLNKEEVSSLIDLDEVREAVENGYRSFNKGLVFQPPIMDVVIPNTHQGIDFKGGVDIGSGYMTIKGSSGGYDKNPELGLPIGMNTVLLFEAKTSALRCVMDGTFITGCRTGAAGAISVKYLAREDAKVLCIIGAGSQARRQLEAALKVRDISEIRVWDALPEYLDSYANEIAEQTGLKVVKCATAQEAVESADIIVTTTRGRSGPLVKKEWVKPGTHIAAIGSDTAGKQEIDAEIFAGAKIVTDSTELCIKRGETSNAVNAGIIQPEDVHAEIGEILLGQKPGRTNAEEITIFDTVGMAIQDIVTAGMLYQRAMDKNIGTWYEFFK